MKLIRHLTWQNMKHSRTRTLVTILGIILSTAMFTAVTTMGLSFHAYLLNAEVAQRGDYFVQYDYGTMEDLEDLRQNELVTKSGALKTLGYTGIHYETDNRSVDDTFILGAGDPDFFQMIPVHLIEGRAPEKSGEIAVTGQFQDYLRDQGKACELGDQITLTVEPAYESASLELPVGKAPFEETYTVVGITEYTQYYYDIQLGLNTLLTVDDGSHEGIWGRFFAKTEPKDAYALAEQFYGQTSSLNHDLLNLYGVSQYSTINDLLVSFSAILILIIMVGSVSLIYNAFSISVSERTKQFGLLSSVGATRRQIRKCVLTEALYLSAAGIPLGILSGYMGISVTLHLTHDMIDSLLWTAEENGIALVAIPSIPAFAVAGVVALVTVLISAWIPARRATRITPISAIRQTQEYKIPKRGIRAGGLSEKLFGLPAALARKYYTVNKRKYRATVISLTISMVLFVSAGCFVQQLNVTAADQVNTDNFDLEIFASSQETLDAVRANPNIKDSALTYRDVDGAYIPEEDFSEEYRAIWEKGMGQEGQMSPSSISDKYVHLTYVEDAVLEAFLKEQGLDPAPYLDPDDPLALVSGVYFTSYETDEKGRPTDRQRILADVFQNSGGTLSLFPDYLDGFKDDLGGQVYNQGFTVEDGVPVHSILVQREQEDGSGIRDIHYKVEVRPRADGHTFDYYLRDPATGEAEAQSCGSTSLDRTQVRLGAAVRDLPMGVRQATAPESITVILPLSAAPQDIQAEDLNLAVTVSDYEAAIAYLEENEYTFSDHLAAQMQYRDYITMIRVFSYGFITLISLICVCNVFNTISTNISLRRKDFGMLRSVGMKHRELNRMMAFECLQYGLKALLWGIPLSLLSALGIASIVGLAVFTPPVRAMAVAAGCIFVTVFITMFYAVHKLKTQNPMEAIRSEE